MGVEPPTLDTIRMSCSPAATVSQHITQTLVELDVDGTLKPSLAESWEVSPDGLVWTLRLRQGVEFHDGTPFNAEAVKFNLDRFLDPASRAPFRFLIARITEVKVVGEYGVSLHLDAPFAPMLAHLSHAFIGMLSPTAVKALGEGVRVDEPVGTGPFKFVEWLRGERIILERNEDYWGKRPYLDEVVFKFVPEDAARIMMLEAGDAHAIMRVLPMDVPRLEADPAIDVVHADSVRTIYIGFNTQREPFTDIRVRQAINYAVNKEEIVEFILGGAGRVSDAPISTGIFGYRAAAAGPYEYNPEKARRLLAEAGFPHGFETTLHHPTGRYMMDVAIVEAVQAQLREVGIVAELVTMEWAAYLAFTRKPLEESKLEMYLLGWGTVTGDADYGLYPLFHTTQWVPAGSARSFYSNVQVDLLLDKARVTPVSELRKNLYGQIIDILWYEAPWLFLHSEVQINAQRKGVHGLIHHPMENIFAWEAWIEQDAR
ncbi:MAG: Glutathione-binding protein GsiB [Dehalococcoidia bacterium]|nr:Glutathione-binding protein GsiB [Bacillota bacterium]